MIHESANIDQLNDSSRGTLAKHLGIVYTDIGPDFIEAKMPVNDSTRQPYGILHGGASAALAETLGSIGSYLCIDSGNFISVGLEINANHVRSVSEGFVTGKATIIHEGRSTHVWDVRITNEDSQLVCIARLTVSILPRK